MTTDTAGLATVVYPRGVYSIWPDVLSFTPLADQKGVVGVLLNERWADLEPTLQGSYDWTRLEARFAEAKQYNLKIALTIADSPINAPGWLIGNPNVKTLDFLDTNPYHSTYCTTLPVALFWDPIFHHARRQMIRAVGAHFASDPTLVAVMGAFANAHTDDWSVPHNVGTAGPGCAKTVDQVQQWRDAGYTTAKLVTMGEEILNTTAAAFPNQAIKLPLHDDGALDGLDPVEQILAFAAKAPWAHRFYPQMNFLTTQTALGTDPTIVNASPSSMGPYLLRLIVEHSPNVGIQMVGGAANGPSDNCRQNGKVSPCTDITGVIQTSLDVAETYRPTFVELWKSDGSYTPAASVLVAATRTLGGTPRP